MRRSGRRRDPARLIPALRRYQAQVAGLGVAISACVVVQALALADALAVGVGGRDPASAVTPAMVALGAFLVRAVAGWMAEVLGRRAGSAAMHELRERLVRATLSGAPAGHGDHRAGDLAMLAVHGGAAVERWAGRVLLHRALAVTTPLAALATIAVVDPLSSALLAPTIPLLIVFLVLAGWDARRVADERLGSLTLLGAHTLDVIRGLPVLRSFGRARIQERELAIAGEAYRRDTVATLRSAFTSSFALEFIAMLGTALVAVVAGVRLIHGSMGFEAAMGALLLAPELYVPLRNLGVEYHAAADARATIERVWDAGETPALVPQGRPGSGAADPGDGPIELLDVTVRPPGAGRATVRGLTLRIEPGATTALVGPSGAGKTTVLRLLLGLELPAEGSIRCAGRSLDDMDLVRWRAGISWLPQRPVVLPATLRENLRLARRDADDRSLWAALAVARLDGWARDLPGGLDAVLGDGGVAISAGERRRLGLARLALRDAGLVLADEPTANLDSVTAALVLDSLADIVAGRTAVIVTHEADALALADRVVMVGDGRVAGGARPVEVAA